MRARYENHLFFEKHRIDPYFFCFLGADSLSELRLRVSKKHLMVASPRARKMFEGGYRESQKSEADGLYHWRVEPLFDPEALKIVLKIIHTRFLAIPDEVTFEMMTAIAEVVDDLQCHEAMSFCVNVWINRLPQPIPSKMCEDLVRWIFIASVFRFNERFKQATKMAIMYSEGPIETMGLPLRPSVTGKSSNPQ
jgi:hypothetical protein